MGKGEREQKAGEGEKGREGKGGEGTPLRIFKFSLG